MAILNYKTLGGSAYAKKPVKTTTRSKEASQYSTEERIIQMSYDEKVSYLTDLARGSSRERQRLMRLAKRLEGVEKGLDKLSAREAMKNPLAAGLLQFNTKTSEDILEFKNGNYEPLVKKLATVTTIAEERKKGSSRDITSRRAATLARKEAIILHQEGRSNLLDGRERQMYNSKNIIYDKSKAAIWSRTAGTVANDIFDWLTDEQKKDFMNSKYFVEMSRDYDEYNSDGLREFKENDEDGLSLQARRIVDWCKEEGIDIPVELLDEGLGIGETGMDDIIKAQRERWTNQSAEDYFKQLKSRKDF